MADTDSLKSWVLDGDADAIQKNVAEAAANGTDPHLAQSADWPVSEVSSTVESWLDLATETAHAEENKLSSHNGPVFELDFENHKRPESPTGSENNDHDPGLYAGLDASIQIVNKDGTITSDKDSEALSVSKSPTARRSPSLKPAKPEPPLTLVVQSSPFPADQNLLHEIEKDPKRAPQRVAQAKAMPYNFKSFDAFRYQLYYKNSQYLFSTSIHRLELFDSPTNVKDAFLSRLRSGNCQNVDSSFRLVYYPIADRGEMAAIKAKGVISKLQTGVAHHVRRMYIPVYSNAAAAIQLPGAHSVLVLAAYYSNVSGLHSMGRLDVNRLWVLPSTPMIPVFAIPKSDDAVPKKPNSPPAVKDAK